MSNPLAGHNSGRLPDFVIIGAMRSGTTGLFRALGRHPQIWVPKDKELHFFDRNFGVGADLYAKRFRPASRDVIVGESTPNYLYDPPTPARMFRTIPNARLIALLRNPIDRAYSHYWHRRAGGGEDLSFEGALKAEHHRITKGKLARAHFSYLNRGFYDRQLTRFEDQFGREPIHVEIFEELTGDPKQRLAAVLNHLGINPDIELELRKDGNSYTEFRSLHIRALRQRLPFLLAWPLARLNQRRSAAYPPMRAATRQRLQDHFHESVRRLEGWLQRDLSPWWDI